MTGIYPWLHQAFRWFGPSTAVWVREDLPSTQSRNSAFSGALSGHEKCMVILSPFTFVCSTYPAVSDFRNVLHHFVLLQLLDQHFMLGPAHGSDLNLCTFQDPFLQAHPLTWLLDNVGTFENAERCSEFVRLNSTPDLHNLCWIQWNPIGYTPLRFGVSII